jgi:hypothetical protein
MGDFVFHKKKYRILQHNLALQVGVVATMLISPLNL